MQQRTNWSLHAGLCKLRAELYLNVAQSERRENMLSMPRSRRIDEVNWWSLIGAGGSSTKQTSPLLNKQISHITMNKPISIDYSNPQLRIHIRKFTM